MDTKTIGVIGLENIYMHYYGVSCPNPQYNLILLYSYIL